MSTVENWSPLSRFISTGWLLVWVAVGTALLWTSSAVVGGIYLVLWICQFVSCRHLACTRCHYYGKKCYMLGGDCARLLF